MRQIEANEVETFFFQIINLDGFFEAILLCKRWKW